MRVWLAYIKKNLHADGSVTKEKKSLKDGIYWTYFQGDGGYMTSNRYRNGKFSHKDEEVYFYRHQTEPTINNLCRFEK